jgi:tetratricopeptide (TPR) repeat protein
MLWLRNGTPLKASQVDELRRQTAHHRRASPERYDRMAQVTAAAARRHGDPVLLGWALAELGNADRRLCRWGQAAERLEEALRCAVAGPDPYLEAQVGSFRGSLAMDLGQYTGGQQVLTEALALAERLDDRRLTLVLSVKLGLLHHRAGDPKGSVLQLDAANRHLCAEPTGKRLVLDIAKTQASNFLALDAVVHALRTLDTIRPLAYLLGGREVLDIRWLTARALALQDAHEEALEELQVIAAELLANHLPYDAAIARLDLAELELRRGHPLAAAQAAQAALAFFTAKHLSGPATEALEILRDGLCGTLSLCDTVRARHLLAWLPRAHRVVG